jgi:hypothetical protein
MGAFMSLTLFAMTLQGSFHFPVVPDLSAGLGCIRSPLLSVRHEGNCIQPLAQSFPPVAAGNRVHREAKRLFPVSRR